MKRLSIALALAALMAVAVMPAASAGAEMSDQDRKEAAGWGCAEAVGLPAGHCINPSTTRTLLDTGSLPDTFQLLVFDGDGSFLAAEIATFKASADTRACPQDPKSPDGTYWEFIEGVLYVCHHQPA